MDCKIDFVVPMVFPSDAHWQEDYMRSTTFGGLPTQNVRFRSWDNEELLVLCIRKFMPWLNRIHILLASETQVQDWMRRMQDEGCPLSLVFHKDFIPEIYLPCFNVNTIEMHLHRIPGLSEYFIYSNDDFFPLSPLKREDFFRERDGCLLPCQHHEEKLYPARPNVFQRFVMNGLNMVAADFGKRFTDTWLRGGHSMNPMLKSTVDRVCALHAGSIKNSFTFHRTDRNYNQYIFPFYQHFSGCYIDYRHPSRYVGPNVATKELERIILDPEAGVVCINDNECIGEWRQRADVVRRAIAEKLRM